MLDAGPFDSLKEKLLKGGIAPWRVRRYLAELDDHLADLTEAELAAGTLPQEATQRARVVLGNDSDLADAWLAQPKLKSFTARAPWLVFGLLPPVAAVLAVLPIYAFVYFIGDGAAKINAVVPLPQNWLIGFSTTAMTAVNVLAVPVIVMTLAWLASRQRLKLVWPLLGIALLLMLTPEFSSRFGHHHDGSLQVGYGLVIPSQWSEIVRFWPLMLSHLLALPPVVWLIHRRRSAA